MHAYMLINSDIELKSSNSYLYIYKCLFLKLYCGVNYFGANCETYCDENNEYYHCDADTGARICREGFLGDECQIRNLFFIFYL